MKPGLPTDGWTPEQREAMRTSALEEHGEQSGQWKWRQSCQCRRCREEYARVLATQRR